MSLFAKFSKRKAAEAPDVTYTLALRDYDSFKDIVLHQRLSDDLGLFAARLNIYPDKSSFVDYVMKNQLAGFGLTEEEMMQRCFEEFTPREVEDFENEQGENLLCLGGIPCCTAVIGLPESYGKFKEWLRSEHIIAGIVNPDNIMFAAQGSSFEQYIFEQVKKSDYMGAVALTPSVNLWNKDGIKKVFSQRQ